MLCVREKIEKEDPMSAFEKWFVVLRAYSLPASVVPISIAGIYSYTNGWFRSVDFMLVFIAGVLIHLAGNLFNTYYDFINGVDKDGSDDIGLISELTKPQIVITLAWFFVVISSLIGLFFVLKYSLWMLLPIAVFGIFLTIFYTANPISLKYHAVGEVVIFLCFGPLIVSGSVMIFAKRFVWESVLYSLPVALLIVNILLANNIRDESLDRDAKIKTIVHLLGIKGSEMLYIALHIGSYLLSFYITGLNLVYLILLPFTVQAINMLRSKQYITLTRHSAKIVLVYGMVFIAAILW